METPQILGIAGAFGSGKSTAADFLQKKGYQHITLSQFLEEELEKNGETEITRKKLQDLGNAWRKEFGNAVLVEKALQYAKEHGWEYIVIEGFRNPDEI